MFSRIDKDEKSIKTKLVLCVSIKSLFFFYSSPIQTWRKCSANRHEISLDNETEGFLFRLFQWFLSRTKTKCSKLLPYWCSVGSPWLFFMSKAEMFMEFVYLCRMWNIPLKNFFFFRFEKVHQHLASNSFALEKIPFIVTVAMKMMAMVIFMPNERVNYYRRYIVYHILLSINEMRIKN